MFFEPLTKNKGVTFFVIVMCILITDYIIFDNRLTEGSVELGNILYLFC